MSKRVYVAGIPQSATEEQVLKLFDRVGRIWRGVFKHGECRTPTNKVYPAVDTRTMRPQRPDFINSLPPIRRDEFNRFACAQHIGYAFLDFDTHDGARNAIKMHDGQLFLGRRLVVEYGYSQPSKGQDDLEALSHSDLSINSIPLDERSTGGSHIEYGITLTGLPSTAGYQELRSFASRHCSGVADVILGTDVDNGIGTAYLVFTSSSKAKAAMRELNGLNLRGFRIQSEELMPRDMEKLVKWGWIKSPLSPLSRTSSVRPVITSASGSLQGRITDEQLRPDSRRRRASRSRTRSRSPLATYRGSSRSRRHHRHSDDSFRQIGSSRTDIPEADRSTRRYYESRPSHRHRSRSPFVRSGRRSPSPRSGGRGVRHYLGNAPPRGRSPSPMRTSGFGPRMLKGNGPRRYRSRSRSRSPRRQDEPYTSSVGSSARTASAVKDGKENKSPTRAK